MAQRPNFREFSKPEFADLQIGERERSGDVASGSGSSLEFDDIDDQPRLVLRIVHPSS